MIKQTRGFPGKIELAYKYGYKDHISIDKKLKEQCCVLVIVLLLPSACAEQRTPGP